MAVRPIVVVPDDTLNMKAEQVVNIDEHVVALAKDMAETMYKAPGVGLAANQVGELVSLIVLDVEYAYAQPKDKVKRPIYIVNPRITHGEGQVRAEEGCLSVPDLGVEISRYERVQVQGVDLEGKPVSVEAEGLLARALQHEIDHINGTTILEHASVLKRNMYTRRLRKKARRTR